jgi:hypothetical protein
LNRREFLRWGAGALVAVGTPGSALASPAATPEPLALVVARNSPIERLSRFELKKLYLGSNLQTSSGERIFAFHQASDAPERSAFERSALDMQSEQLARYWIDRKIRGEGGAPRAVASVELLQRVLIRLPSAVTYLRMDQVGPELRAVPIDGMLPGDSGYPLWSDGLSHTRSDRAGRDKHDFAIVRSLADLAL